MGTFGILSSLLPPNYSLEPRRGAPHSTRGFRQDIRPTRRAGANPILIGQQVRPILIGCLAFFLREAPQQRARGTSQLEAVGRHLFDCSWMVMARSLFSLNGAGRVST
jgi:hypothetical protein